LDGNLKTGRAIGILGTILGPISILLLLTTSFMAVPRRASLTLGIVTGVTMSLFCGIMFIGIATTACSGDFSDFMYYYDDSDYEDYYDGYDYGDPYYDESTYAELDATCRPAARGYLLIPALLFWIGGSIPLCICFKEQRPRDRQTSPEQQISPIQASANYSYPGNNIEMPQEGFATTSPVASTTLG
jgi:hypothetical protein